jgi:uncharacterized protein
MIGRNYTEDRHSASLSGAPALVQPLEAKLAGFSRLLRQHGFGVGLSETQDAVRIADLWMCVDFAAFQAGLRSLMCTSAEQMDTFDRLFEGYWAPEDAASRIDPDLMRREPKPIQGSQGVPGIDADGDPDAEPADHATRGASARAMLGRLDFSQMAVSDRRILEQMADRLWKRLTLAQPRRLRGAQWKTVLHLRRTARRNLSQGGDPVHLVYSGHKPRKPRLVVLLDVSGSMELYSFFLLRLLHALHGRFRKVHSFVFATELAEITDCLKVRHLDEALRRVAQRSLGWNGGTRLGDCLIDLLECHGRRVLRSDTAVIVCSDGLDVGAPERLATGMRELKARSRRIVWLNPLLDTPGYEPLQQGMQAALPYIDVFAAAHNAESISRAGRWLRDLG